MAANKRFRYTKEEDEWILKNYPALGAKIAFSEFQKVFGNRHTLESFKSRRRDLKIHVTEERWREACLNNGQRSNVPVGTIVKRGRGENWIKVSDGTKGWIPLKQHLVGKQPEGMGIVHLDGNKSNDSIDNLAVINRKVSARMSHNKFWSENAVITATAIKCCELESLLNDE